MAPPITSASTLSNSFSNTSILSDTFAPPTMAKKGLAGLFLMRPKNSNSLRSKNPAALGRSFGTPAVLAWAR
jgi:hypothetical protein